MVANLTLGLSPILWGVFIDALKGLHVSRFGIEWTRFTVFFSAAALSIVVTGILAQRLDEPKAATFDKLLHDLLVQSPQRVWFRMWPRS